MSFLASIRRAEIRTGKSFWQLCREKGAAGGRKAAANKRRARAEHEKFHMEQSHQVAMKLKDADEVLSPQDVASIAIDQKKRRVA